MPNFGHIVRRRPARLLRWLSAVALGCLVVSAPRAAELVVIGDIDQQYFQSFVTEFARTPGIANRYGKPLVADLADADTSGKIASAKVVVTVGNEAARLYHPQGERGVMVHALMTEGHVARLKAAGECGERNHAVLLVEQPVARYLAAIKTALPGRNRLGVLYGPQSLRHQQDVQRLAKELGLTLVELSIGREDELGTALSDVLPRIDVLLALPDQVVVNANTARTLILDTYLRGVALVGYSNSMVKAGALMAIHSTPQQLGQQTATIVTQLTSSAVVAGEKDIYPAHFDVSINYQVARILGVDLPDEAVLRERILSQGGRP